MAKNKLAKRSSAPRRSFAPSAKTIQKWKSEGARVARAGARRASETASLQTIGGAAAYGAIKGRTNLPTSFMGVGLDLICGGLAIGLPLFAPKLVNNKMGRTAVNILTGPGCLAAARLAAGGGLAGEAAYEDPSHDDVEVSGEFTDAYAP